MDDTIPQETPQDNTSAIRIPLTHGKFALIDEIDADLLQFRWLFSAQGYAYRNLPRNHGQPKMEYLHRVILERILGRPLLPHQKTDHHDTDRLNNRRENLRLATSSQNATNRSSKTTRTAVRPYKGVEYHRGKWRVRIRVDGKVIYLGLYKTPEEAAIVYNEAAQRYHKEFARGNEGLPDVHVESTVGQLSTWSKSGYRGVSQEGKRGQWRASLTYQGKHISLGYYTTPQEAARAYNEAALRYYGSHAHLNSL